MKVKEDKEEKPYMTVAEVAVVFQVSEKTVVRWANEKKIPFMKTLGGHRRFPRAEIMEKRATVEEAAN